MDLASPVVRRRVAIHVIAMTVVTTALFIAGVRRPNFCMDPFQSWQALSCYCPFRWSQFLAWSRWEGWSLDLVQRSSVREEDSVKGLSSCKSISNIMKAYYLSGCLDDPGVDVSRTTTPWLRSETPSQHRLLHQKSLQCVVTFIVTTQPLSETFATLRCGNLPSCGYLPQNYRCYSLRSQQKSSTDGNAGQAYP